MIGHELATTQASILIGAGRHVILDIGTGDGSVTAALASNRSNYIVALEPNPAQFRRASVQLEELENVELHNDELRCLNLRRCVDEALLLFPDIRMLGEFRWREYQAIYASLKDEGRVTLVTECVPSLAPGFEPWFTRPANMLNRVGFAVCSEEVAMETALQRLPELVFSSVFKTFFGDSFGPHWAISQVRAVNRLGVIQAKKESGESRASIAKPLTGD